MRPRLEERQLRVSRALGTWLGTRGTCGGCSRWRADTAERGARREAATWSWAELGIALVTAGMQIGRDSACVESHLVYKAVAQH